MRAGGERSGETGAAYETSFTSYGGEQRTPFELHELHRTHHSKHTATSSHLLSNNQRPSVILPALSRPQAHLYYPWFAGGDIAIYHLLDLIIQQSIRARPRTQLGVTAGFWRL